MLRIILLSLLWAVCSTRLVRLWFWKGIIKKNIFCDNGTKIVFDNSDWKGDLLIEIVYFATIFLFSFFSYYVGNVTQNIHSSYPIIFLSIFAHFFWSNQRKVHYFIMTTLIVICFILYIQNLVAICYINIPSDIVNNVQSYNYNSHNDADLKSKCIVSSDDIKRLFKVNSVTGPIYNNGKYIFTVSGENKENDIVIIDKNNQFDINLIPCSYDMNIKHIRHKYPSQEILKLSITVSNDNVPYALFAIADKSWLLGGYEVTCYVMLNLVTGEICEFTQEQLLSFVGNN